MTNCFTGTSSKLLEMADVKCSECQETEAIQGCIQCDHMLCLQCSTSLHKFKINQSHERALSLNEDKEDSFAEGSGMKDVENVGTAHDCTQEIPVTTSDASKGKQVWAMFVRWLGEK